MAREAQDPKDPILSTGKSLPFTQSERDNSAPNLPRLRNILTVSDGPSGEKWKTRQLLDHSLARSPALGNGGDANDDANEGEHVVFSDRRRRPPAAIGSENCFEIDREMKERS